MTQPNFAIYNDETLSDETIRDHLVVNGDTLFGGTMTVDNLNVTGTSNLGTVSLTTINAQTVNTNNVNSNNGTFGNLDVTGQLTIGNYIMPGGASPNDGVLAVQPGGTVEFYVRGLLIGLLTAAQMIDISPNDHIKFDTLNLSRGNGIVLDTTSPYTSVLGQPSIGRFTLSGPKIYRLDCMLFDQTMTANPIAEFAIQFRDATTGLPLNAMAGIDPAGPGEIPKFKVIDGRALVVPTPTQFLEVQIVLQNGFLNQIAGAILIIEELGHY
jgi:hypothetical protein